MPLAPRGIARHVLRRLLRVLVPGCAAHRVAAAQALRHRAALQGQGRRGHGGDPVGAS